MVKSDNTGYFKEAGDSFLYNGESQLLNRYILSDSRINFISSCNFHARSTKATLKRELQSLTENVISSFWSSAFRLAFNNVLAQKVDKKILRGSLSMYPSALAHGGYGATQRKPQKPRKK